MATLIENNTSGFLDGYMAGNIAANSSELKAHAEKIKDLLEDVKEKISSSEIESKSTIISAIDKFEKKEIGIEPLGDDYYNYSLNLAEILSQIHNNTINKTPLTSESSYLIKRAIYHFLNIAKTLQDQRIIDEAKRVALQFK